MQAPSKRTTIELDREVVEKVDLDVRRYEDVLLWYMSGNSSDKQEEHVQAEEPVDAPGPDKRRKNPRC
jgi:hypothetical protein